MINFSKSSITLISLMIFFFYSKVNADAPTIFLSILETNNNITVKSHLLWNVDEKTEVPSSYFTGNNKTYTKKFQLGKNVIMVKFYFPEPEDGRRLNASTTVYVTISIDGKKIVQTDHFGQHSEEFVHFDTEILCRPNIISISLNNKQLHLEIDGAYVPPNLDKSSFFPYSDESFHCTFPASSFINDSLISAKVMKYGPVPKTIDFVEENLLIGVSLDAPCIYSFNTSINNPLDDDPYDWDISSFLFCTKKENESKLNDLFNPIKYYYQIFDNQTTMRIFDPNITFFSNEICIDPRNITKTGTNSFQLTNLTEGYTVVNGVEILNPIHQKSLKLSFVTHWNIKSVEVSENTTYKRDGQTIFIYGDGLSRLNYVISVSKGIVK